MLTAGDIAELRALEESRQTDTCKITKPGAGERVRNAATGKYEDPEPVTVYEGKCRIPKRDNGSTVTAAAAGEAAWQVGEYPINLPATDENAANVESGMIVHYLTAEDPALVGREFGIVAPARQSLATARRFRMKEVVGT